MTNYEEELLDLIRNHDDPEQALEIALQTIIAFLEQYESSQVPFVVCSPVLA